MEAALIALIVCIFIQPFVCLFVTVRYYNKPLFSNLFVQSHLCSSFLQQLILLHLLFQLELEMKCFTIFVYRPEYICIY